MKLTLKVSGRLQRRSLSSKIEYEYESVTFIFSEYFSCFNQIKYKFKKLILVSVFKKINKREACHLKESSTSEFKAVV